MKINMMHHDHYTTIKVQRDHEMFQKSVVVCNNSLMIIPEDGATTIPFNTNEATPS